MLGIGNLSTLLGSEGLKLIAAEGDDKKDAPKDEKKKDAPEADAALAGIAMDDMGGAPAPDALAPPIPMAPVWAPGTQLRDIFSGNVGTVAEQPLGDFGDILFVSFDGETSPIRMDQLEPLGDMAGPFGTKETPIPGLEEGTPAAGSPIPGAPAEVSTKPQALPEVPPKTKGEGPKAALLPKTNLKGEDEARFKSDEDIAKEFEGFKITETKVRPEQDHGKDGKSQSVGLNLEFPAAGESVGGGMEGEGPHDVWEDASIHMDATGKVERVLLDNWYPDSVRDAVVKAVLDAAGKTWEEVEASFISRRAMRLKAAPRRAPAPKALWDHEPDEDEIREALEGEGIEFYFERNKSMPSVNVKDRGYNYEDYPEIKKLFDEYNVPEELRAEAVQSTYEHVQENWWDDLREEGGPSYETGPFGEMLQSGKAKVYSAGRSGGHLVVEVPLHTFVTDLYENKNSSNYGRDAYGLDTPYVEGLKKFLTSAEESVQPKYIADMLAGQLEVDLEMGQFGGKVGEWFETVKEEKEKSPGTPENMRMLEREGQQKLPLESKKMKDGRTILVARKKSNKPEVKASDRIKCPECGMPVPDVPEDASYDETLCNGCYEKLEKRGKEIKADLVTSVGDPRNLTYTNLLSRLKAGKEKTHAEVLSIIGYVPEKWDLIVARLAKDGVQLLSPKGSYDVMSLLKKGHNSDEVRLLLASKGVPVYSIDAILKLAAGSPTSPAPNTSPGDNKVWGWDEKRNMWVAIPTSGNEGGGGAAMAVTAKKVKGGAPERTPFEVAAARYALAARVVSDKIAEAFSYGDSKKVGNTHTDGNSVWLHGNEIIKREENGDILISDQGWATNTTRERLNNICQALGLNVQVSQRKGQQTLNGDPWDGEWVKVGSHVGAPSYKTFKKTEQDIAGELEIASFGGGGGTCQRVTDAFEAGKSRKAGNGKTDGTSIWLFGNEIVRREDNGDIMVSNAGWNSVTTRAWLNQITGSIGMDASFSTHKGHAVLNGEPWDGDWTQVGNQKPGAETFDRAEIEAFIADAVTRAKAAGRENRDPIDDEVLSRLVGMPKRERQAFWQAYLNKAHEDPENFGHEAPPAEPAPAENE